ncbi:MAG: sigma-54-dependent Fis family transcriptional regulator [Fibrobacteres bacterium]|nr:sigma-54-dependent Fis family transcriptional regulator [Fibrobacterota bacterium]
MYSNLNDINSIISDLRHPVIQQLRDALFLVDEKGSILKHWNTSDDLPDSIAAILLEKKIITDIFDFDGIKDLRQLDFSKGSYISYATQDHFLHHIRSIGFYTRQPVVRLTLNPVNGDQFLASVSITKSYKAASDPYGGGLIWINAKNGKIEGISSVIYSSLKSTFPKPYDLLGISAEEIISPTPEEIIKGGLNASPAPSDDRFATIVTGDMFLSRPELFEAEKTMPVSGDDRSLMWENKRGNYDFFRIKTPFAPLSQDFFLEIDFEIVKGRWPLFIFGIRNPYVFPDAYGYTAGYMDNEEIFFFKKEGHKIEDSKISFYENSKSFKVRFIKNGQNIHLRVNGRIVLEYHDIDFIRVEQFYPYVGIRPESALKIKNFSVGYKKRDLKEDVREPVIRLKAKDELYYTIKHINNYNVTSSTSLIRSYALYNVTSFEKEKKQLIAIISESGGGDYSFVGSSSVLNTVRENARTAASSGATILIQGETGTGKEVLARYIHQHSPFAEGPFVKVDCSTLSPTIIESELFGHEKGSFTGASDRRKGRLEEADKGVLFLDEISNLSLDIQAKLLNFLQDFTVTRVGGAKTIKTSLQVVAASNIPLQVLVDKGLFRRDLFYRLNVFSFTLPPLRNRLEDLPVLCETFIRFFAARHNKDIKGIEGNTYRRLFDYSWPGNVRELKNVLQRAVVYCDGGEITDEHLKLADSGISEVHHSSNHYVQSAEKTKRSNKPVEVEKERMEGLISEHKGNISKIAEALGVTRVTVYKLAKKHNIAIDDFRK